MEKAPPSDVEMLADWLGHHHEAAFHSNRHLKAHIIAQFKTTHPRSRGRPTEIIPEKPTAETEEAALKMKGRQLAPARTIPPSEVQSSISEKNRSKRGTKPWFLSIEARMPTARPTICFRSTNPKNRESLLLSLESPITKY
jgi:hypothetical protein